MFPSAASAQSDTEPLDPGPWQEFDQGGGNNVVVAENSTDDRFVGRGNAELDRIHGGTVSPNNVAEAHAQCTNCQTIAVALQVALYQRGAPTVTPVNRAVALNTDCSHCVTIARAVQYVVPVDDLGHVPRELNALVRRIDQETNYLRRVHELNSGNVDDVQAHLDQMESDFASLHDYLSDFTDVQQTPDGPPPADAPAAPVPG